jgi:hypothetical protein
MTSNLQLILQTVIAVTDSTGAQVATMDLESPTLAASAAFIDQNVQATIAPLQIQFPAVNMFSMLVQNVGTTPLQIRFAPNLGPQSSFTVGPTGFMVMHDPTETGTGFWFLALSGITTTVPAIVEVGV